MDSVILEYAICKWADRETASYLPINSINEHQTVDGKTVNMVFDAWGRQLGVPTFNYPRPPYEEDLRPSDDIKYYRFDPDDEHKVVVYRMTGYTKVLPSGGSTSELTQRVTSLESSLTSLESSLDAYVESIDELPTPSAENVGKIYLLTESHDDYREGKFYVCKKNGDSYVWEILIKGHPVGDCTHIVCFKMSDSTSVQLKWTDPKNPSSEGVDLAKWQKTIVVRKENSYPENESDGTVIVTSTVRDQYTSVAFTDTVPAASGTYYYGFFPITDDGIVTYSDGTSNRAVTSAITYNTLLDLTRSGELKNYMEVGASFSVEHSEFGELEIQVAGYDAVLPRALRYVAEDNSIVYIHGLNRTVGSVVYSDSDLETKLSDTISAVSGTFSIGNGTNGKESVPGQITVGGKNYICKAHSTVFLSRFLVPTTSGNTSHLTVQFDAPELEYGLSEDTTYQNNKEYYSYDGISDPVLLVAGTDYNVGDTISSAVYEKNHANRKSYGWNRWSKSGIRQYLNAIDNNWWESQNIFDTSPNVSSRQGFLKGFDSDFVDCLGKVLCKTAKNTIDAGGGFEYTEDTIFLPSYAEMFGNSLNSGYDGSQFSLCQTFTTNDDRKKCTKASSLTANPSYQHYWLRSPLTGSVNYVYIVNSSGASYYNLANSALGAAFACALI